MVKDFSRSVDYLRSRPDLDHEKIGFYCYSCPYGPMFTAVETRFQANVIFTGGLLPIFDPPPEADPFNYAPRVKAPTMMIGGRYDFILPLEASQIPLFRLLGAPEKDKKHVLYDTGHVPYPGKPVIKEILDWLDRYLGPVHVK